MNTATGLSGIVTNVVTPIVTVMGNMVTFMTAEGHEICLIGIGFFLAGGAIGLASRIIGR